VTQPTRKPSPSNVSRWFDPRSRQPGTVAFILNRITAIGLTIYLFLHLIVLYRLSQGPEAYDGFLELVHSPIYVFGELLVVAAVLIHGLNGLRVIVNSLGLAVPYQRQLFYIILVFAILATLVFGIRMFTV
jgi:succinate dehydrogenase / fumarate reductase cytochrome b subunit